MNVLKSLEEHWEGECSELNATEWIQANVMSIDWQQCMEVEPPAGTWKSHIAALHNGMRIFYHSMTSCSEF